MGSIRVLHILHSMNRGGAENAIMNYYRNIDRSLVQFDFLLTDSSKCLFEDEILRLGGKVYRIPLLTLKNPFPYLSGVRRFLKVHKEYKIVHSHTSSKSVLPLFIAMICGVRVRCSHSHSSMAEKNLKGRIRLALRPLLKYVATDFLSCGDQAGVYLYGKEAFESGKVKVFKNIIETDRFRFNVDVRSEFRQRLNIGENVVLLGHTARFHPVKNHPFDVEILSELVKMGIEAKLLLVGFGTDEEKLPTINKAKELNVLDRLIFTGVVPNVYDYEQAMDVFLLPSLNEGLPLSIIEAQVSGLPCFTTKNRVSLECSVTDLVTYNSLESGSRKWAESIVEKLKETRTDRLHEIINAGYDAKTSANALQEFYLRRYKEIQ